MVKPMLIDYKRQGHLKLHHFEQYLPTAFDESLSLIEKVNKVIYYLRDNSKITEEMINRWNEVYTWLLNDGLEELVRYRLNEWMADGTFERIINEEVFGNLKTKIDELYESFNELKDNIDDILDEKILEFKDDVNQLINDVKKDYMVYSEGLDNKFSLIDYQKMIGHTVTSISDGEHSRYPQGLMVDYENDKYYVSRQTTGKVKDQKVYEYQLSTNNLLREKNVPTTNWVYLEGLAMYHNSDNNVCFIIPTKRAGEFGIWNFDLNKLERTMQMEGSFKVSIDNNHKYFICSKHADYSDDRLNATHNGFILYDLNSVIQGSPKIVKKVNASNGDMLNPKTQTVTMIDNYLYLGKGTNNTEINVLDTAGNMLYRVSYDKTETKNLIDVNPSVEGVMENEGIDWIIKDGKTYLITTVLTQGKMAIIQHGDTSFTKLKKVPNTESISGLSVLEDNAVMNLTKHTGTPSIDTGVGNKKDILREIENLTSPGMYTIYAHSDSYNLPIERNLTGFVYARSGDGNKITRANVYVMDTTGSTYTNVYDVNYNGDKWLGWNQYGSRGTSLTSKESFNPLKSYNGSFETTSTVNAPPNTGGGIKQYRITQFGGNRKWIECFIPSTNKYFTRSIHTNGVTTNWVER